jgi:DNA-binding GntR family transcriptional regulator
MGRVREGAKFAGPAPGGARGRSAAPGAQGDRVHRLLKTRLLTGDFRPNIRLGEERLAAMFDVSRTPIREALKRLQAEGLVESHPDGGYQPVVPDVTVMRHLYEVRAELELHALQRPGRLGTRHDPSVLEPLRDQWRALADGTAPEPDPGFVLLDEAFHVGLATAAGNDVAVGFLRQVNERIRLVRMHDFLSQERIDLTIAEHLDIVEHVLIGDIIGAEASFSQHIGDSMAVVEERVRGAIVRMLTGGTSP